MVTQACYPRRIGPDRRQRLRAPNGVKGTPHLPPLHVIVARRSIPDSTHMLQVSRTS